MLSVVRDPVSKAKEEVDIEIIAPNVCKLITEAQKQFSTAREMKDRVEDFRRRFAVMIKEHITILRRYDLIIHGEFMRKVPFPDDLGDGMVRIMWNLQKGRGFAVSENFVQCIVNSLPWNLSFEDLIEFEIACILAKYVNNKWNLMQERRFSNEKTIEKLMAEVCNPWFFDDIIGFVSVELGESVYWKHELRRVV